MENDFARKAKAVSQPSMAAGDTVQLKYGGPIMTVQAVSDAGITCICFNDIAGVFTVSQHEFMPVTLKLADTSK